MKNPKNVHIVRRPGGWGALREGGQRVGQIFSTQAEATKKGRQMAKEGRGELFIHGRDGRIRARDSHGHDPFPPRG